MTKVTLKDLRPTKTIALPSFEGSEVVIYGAFVAGDIFDMPEGFDDKNPRREHLVKLLPKIVKSWNFMDESDADIPVTEEALRSLPPEDLVHLLNEFVDFQQEVKKN